jgi:RNA polymerase sigma-70 factor (ECF subfamily)
MPDVHTHADNHLLLDSPHRSASQELQEVLLTRLPSFHRCAMRVLGDAADAEDAVQEALMAAHKHLSQFRGQSRMSTWLTAIVRNSALMRLRRRPRQIHLSLDEPLEDGKHSFVWERLADVRPSPEEECRNTEPMARLRRCATHAAGTRFKISPR